MIPTFPLAMLTEEIVQTMLYACITPAHECFISVSAYSNEGVISAIVLSKHVTYSHASVKVDNIEDSFPLAIRNLAEALVNNSTDTSWIAATFEAHYPEEPEEVNESRDYRARE